MKIKVQFFSHRSSLAPELYPRTSWGSVDKRLRIAALNCAVIWVRVNQAGFQLNGTYQLLFYTDDVHILSGSINTIKKNTEDLVAASKRI